MARKRSRELPTFGTSFLDVLANTIGGLAFLLVLAILLVGYIVSRPPVITTERLPHAYHGIRYETWLGAREGRGEYKWSFDQGRPPLGLQLDPVTGQLHGKPDMGAGNERMKQVRFQVKCEGKDKEGKIATDVRGFAIQAFRISPVRILTQSDLPEASAGESFSLQFAAEGGETPYTWKHEGGDLPPRLRMDKSGRLTGTCQEVGVYRFGATVETVRHQTDRRLFKVKVSERHPPPPPLKVVTTEVPNAVAERGYVLFPAAEGGSPPYRWSIVSGKPSWMRPLAGSASFGGEPGVNDVREDTVVWEVKDSRGGAARSEAIKLTVVDPPGKRPPEPKIRTVSLPEARAGQPYSLAIAVKGGALPLKWELASGSAAPPGLSFKDGDLTGTPNKVGKHRLTVRVVDHLNRPDEKTLALVVRPAPLPLEIVTRAAPAGRAEEAYSLALSAVGGYPPYTWKHEGGKLPPKLLMDKSGRLTGTCQQAGTYAFTVTVVDAEGTRTTGEPLNLKMEVLTKYDRRPLVITTQEIPVLLRDESSETTLACEGGAGPYEWSVVGSLPEGLELQGADIVGTPSESGDYVLKVRVTDLGGKVDEDGNREEAEKNLRITVRKMIRRWIFVISVIVGVLAIALAVWLLIALRKSDPPPIPPLEILTKEIPNGRASCVYSVQLAAVGGVLPYRWRLVEGELPPGLELEEDGRLHGVPFKDVFVGQTKDIPFTVEVRDGRGQTARQGI